MVFGVALTRNDTNCNTLQQGLILTLGNSLSITMSNIFFTTVINFLLMLVNTNFLFGETIHYLANRYIFGLKM